MPLGIITVVHMEPEIAAMSCMRLLRTSGIPHDKIDGWAIVDNIWPINRENGKDCVKALGRLHENMQVLVPDKNVGGHGGFNLVLEMAADELTEDDLILGYDPDSYPVTPGWGKAMMEVMRADPKMGYVSLLHNHCVNNREWRRETIGGHAVAFHPQTDMFNVTMFRLAALKKGLLAGSGFYGFVETAMASHVDSIGLKRGYMYDFREDLCPIQHPDVYNRWKRDHAGGNYPGNFDEYLRQHGNP